MHALARLILILLWLMPATVFAKHSSEFGHSFEQVWGSAVRMIRVDYGFPIRDRDQEIGYILFDYKDSDRSYPASLEVVRATQDDRDVIRVVIQINGMPGYIERMMLDKLEAKLRNDFGVPPERPRKKPIEAPPEEPPAKEPGKAPQEDKRDT